VMHGMTMARTNPGMTTNQGAAAGLAGGIIAGLILSQTDGVSAQAEANMLVRDLRALIRTPGLHTLIEQGLAEAAPSLTNIEVVDLWMVDRLDPVAANRRLRELDADGFLVIVPSVHMTAALESVRLELDVTGYTRRGRNLREMYSTEVAVTSDLRDDPAFLSNDLGARDFLALLTRYWEASQAAEFRPRLRQTLVEGLKLAAAGIDGRYQLTSDQIRPISVDNGMGDTATEGLLIEESDSRLVYVARDGVVYSVPLGQHRDLATEEEWQQMLVAIRGQGSDEPSDGTLTSKAGDEPGEGTSPESSGDPALVERVKAGTAGGQTSDAESADPGVDDLADGADETSDSVNEGGDG
jgi:hypothetical protein